MVGQGAKYGEHFIKQQFEAHFVDIGGSQCRLMPENCEALFASLSPSHVLENKIQDVHTCVSYVTR